MKRICVMALAAVMIIAIFFIVIPLYVKMPHVSRHRAYIIDTPQVSTPSLRMTVLRIFCVGPGHDVWHRRSFGGRPFHADRFAKNLRY